MKDLIKKGKRWVMVTACKRAEKMLISKKFMLFLMIWLAGNSVYSQGKVIEKGKTYYVAPDGRDADPGTKAKPWKSFGKASRALKAGDTAVLDDGDYFEEVVATFAHSGTKENPIVLQAKNKRQARIIFSERLKGTAKIRIAGRKFIELRDLEITQVARSQEGDLNRTSDILIQCSVGSEEISLIGNHIHYCFEDGIKVASSKSILIKNNKLSEIEHEGIDAVNVENLVIDGNVINEVGRVGILVKGGSRNALVIDNVIRNEHKKMNGHGIAIGGETRLNGQASSKDYEAYNVYVKNNVVVAKNKGRIRWGISFIGAKDSQAVNNVVVGTYYGIGIYSPNGLRNGWGWNPLVTNATIENNILYDIKKDALYFNHQPVDMKSDYNLFYKIGGRTPSNEKHSLNKDPLFIDPYSNWKLKPGSPGIGSATIVKDPPVVHEKRWIKRGGQSMRTTPNKNRGLNH